MAGKPIPTWSGTVSADGTLRLDSIALFRRYCDTLKNKPVTVTVKTQTRAKSRSQLGYWWAVVIPMIAENCGYRPYEHDAVHDAVMRELRGLKPDPNPLKLRHSMAEASHEEVSVLIEDARYWAMDTLGLVIPDPTKVEAA